MHACAARQPARLTPAVVSCLVPARDMYSLTSDMRVCMWAMGVHYLRTQHKQSIFV